MNSRRFLTPLLILMIFLAGCASALPFAGIPALSVSPAPVADLQVEAPASQPISYNPAQIDTGVLAQVQATFQQIYQTVNPSVVNIQTVQQVSNGWQTGLASGQGSGFVWDMTGHIVTNSHVVEGASAITVTFADGTVLDAELVGADPESDLAVIHVDAGAVELQPVTLADSRVVQVGDLVIAIGNPFGLSGTMTQGIVSALSRSLEVSADTSFSTGSYTIPDIIQTDAAINPGNSGGVLVDVQGRVVGVTAAIRSATNSNAGIGFVIPSHIVQRIVPVLIADGSYTHPRMGISGLSLTPDVAKQAGLDRAQKGILIMGLSRGGPAERAGMVASTQQRGANGMAQITLGDVIVAIDGQPVKSFDDLSSYLFNNTEVGQEVMVTVLRGGAEQAITLTLGSGS